MSTAILEQTQKHAMQCMEIWGGNHAVGTVAEFRNGPPPEDDLTVLLLHHNADNPPKSPLM